MQQQYEIKRKYIAIIEGQPKVNSGTIDAPIGRKDDSIIERAVVENGKRAITHYSVLDKGDKYSLVEIKLETGSTKHIRVHFYLIGYNIVSDHFTVSDTW